MVVRFANRLLLLTQWTRVRANLDSMYTFLEFIQVNHFSCLFSSDMRQHVIWALTSCTPLGWCLKQGLLSLHLHTRIKQHAHRVGLPNMAASATGAVQVVWSVHHSNCHN